MADNDTANPPFGFDPAGFGRMGEKQTEALTAMQRELAALVEEANRNWLKRAELERDLASDLVSKLSAARTLPDAAKAYQDWMTRRMQALTEDGQKMFAESQKFMAAAARFMTMGVPKPD